jgi:hypothetical protein
MLMQSSVGTYGQLATGRSSRLITLYIEAYSHIVGRPDKMISVHESYLSQQLTRVHIVAVVLQVVMFLVFSVN